MKTKIFTFIISLIFVSSLQAQIVDQLWENPINKVKFKIKINFGNNTMVQFGNNAAVDTTGNPQNISQEDIENIFGINAQLDPSIIQNYQDLLDTSKTNSLGFLAMSTWGNTISDTTEYDYCLNLTQKLQGKDLGIILSTQWQDLSVFMAKQLIDTIIPIIAGDDMDYSIDIPNGINKVFDLKNFKTDAEELTAIQNHQIYTYDLTEFQNTYDQCVVWMQDNKLIIADSVNYSDILDWIDEFFSTHANFELQKISVDEWEQSFSFVHLGNGNYQIFNKNNSPWSITLFNNKGQKLYLNRQNDSFSLSHYLPGVYFIRIQNEQKKVFVRKLIYQ
ncbi:MAG: T9SS type A sorting domain-containing protein [Flavobacteriales bacterium]|jgi:hypothetical protein|nr:T9SS type A sorting domain-containing protein [Flavobacteriales bacterium]